MKPELAEDWYIDQAYEDRFMADEDREDVDEHYAREEWEDVDDDLEDEE